MKKTIVSTVLIAVLAGGGMLLAYPKNAQAEWGGRHHGYYRHWHGWGPIIALPSNSVGISVGGFNFFYSEGEYYRPCSGGYVIVPAPIGACVPVLPPACRPVVVENATYYNYDGAYYQQVPNGYTVVPVGLTKAIPVKAIPVQEQESTIVVNIPNKNGSYTPVTLQLAANGMYIGPQGEVYPTKPEMKQLQEMYGK